MAASEGIAVTISIPPESNINNLLTIFTTKLDDKLSAQTQKVVRTNHMTHNLHTVYIHVGESRRKQ